MAFCEGLDFGEPFARLSFGHWHDGDKLDLILGMDFPLSERFSMLVQLTQTDLWPNTLLDNFSSPSHYSIRSLSPGLSARIPE